jgi:probable rRNA maturation factor
VPGPSCRFGDIIISYPRAAAQAAELGHSIVDELTLLLVHGTLHLLGYGHQTANEAKKMAQREKAIIRSLS